MIKRRDDIILEYCKGKSVLDLGCVDHDVKNMVSESSLHSKIKSVAREVVGVDIIDAPGIVRADVRDFDLGRTFDVVVAGELIEHIDDHRGFLRSVRRHMRKDSIFILSTPNAFSYVFMLEYVVRKEKIVNPDHVCWFSEKTIRRLLESNGFEIMRVERATLMFDKMNTIGKAIHFISSVLGEPDTLVVVSKMKDGGQDI